MKTSLRAFLLDFDGVIADSEPLHFSMYQKVLADLGVELLEDDYYQKYLGLDDRGCFQAIFRDRSKPLSDVQLIHLIEKKHQAFLEAIKGRSILLPGAAEFIEKVAPTYYVAIVSGALRSEIVTILSAFHLEGKIQVIIAAEDVIHGKPDSEGFLRAIRLLNKDFVPPSEILIPEECLAIEDSPWGLEAAKKAGVKCVALLTSYSREHLTQADLICPNLKTFPWEKAAGLF